MTYVALLFLIIAAAAAAGILLNKRARNRNALTGPLPYYARKPLSDSEQELYHRLVKALPERIILAQVALSRILRVRKGHHAAAFFAGAISKNTLDFVICARNFGIVAAIEMDDGTPVRPTLRAANALKERALEAAGVKLLRWQAHALPEESAIRAALSSQGSKRVQEPKPVQAARNPAHRGLNSVQPEMKPAQAGRRPVQPAMKAAQAERDPGQSAMKRAPAEHGPAQPAMKPALAEREPAQPAMKPALAERDPAQPAMKPAQAEREAAAQPEMKPAQAERELVQAQHEPAQPAIGLAQPQHESEQAERAPVNPATKPMPAEHELVQAAEDRLAPPEIGRAQPEQKQPEVKLVQAEHEPGHPPAEPPPAAHRQEDSLDAPLLLQLVDTQPLAVPKRLENLV